MKEALLLDANAKYVWNITFKTLEPKLPELRVGLRSINDRWAWCATPSEGWAN